MAKIESNDFEEYEYEEEEEEVAGTDTPEGSEETSSDDTGTDVIPEEDDDTEMVVAKRPSSFVGIVILLIIVALIGLSVGVYFLIKSFSSDVVDTGKIYPGVNVNGYSLEGMTKEEAEAYITNTYVTPVITSSVKVQAGSETFTYPLKDFVTCPDAAAIAEEAYKVARTGTERSRVEKIADLKTNPVNFSVSYSVSEEPIGKMITDAYNALFAGVENPSYKLMGDRVVFTPARMGVNVDTATLKTDLEGVFSSIRASLSGITPEGVSLDIPSVTVRTDTVEFYTIDAEEIMNKIYTTPVDAYLERKSLYEIAVIDDIPGVSIDENELRAAVDSVNSGEDFLYKEVLFTEVPAEVTAQSLYDILFRDCMGQEMSANKPADPQEDIVPYNERAVNIKLAVEKINGYCLMPGESFNFFTVVGDVNIYKGFVEAYENTMENKKIVGGGISQVASAIYVAALLSDLKITERSNNKYIPNYGNPGFDAYVSQSRSPFTFQNNTENPIRITVTYDEEKGFLTAAIYGTDFRTQKFTLSSEIASVERFNTLRIEDPSLPFGEQVVEEGINGYTFNLYRISNNVKTSLGTARFEKKDKIIRVGTFIENSGEDEGERPITG